VHTAFEVAQHGDAHVDGLDRPGDAADGDEVAELVLIFGQNQEPREVVFHQVLRAECDRNADDRSASEHCRDVDTAFLQHEHHGHYHDDDAGRASEAEG